MARIFFLLVLIAAAFAGSAGSASAFFAGSLDCRATVPVFSALGYKARCSFFPVVGFPTVSTGTINQISVMRLRLRLRQDVRAVWEVYSSGLIVAALSGTYTRVPGSGTSLIGGPANLIELRPAQDVPGEDVGPNTARFVTHLILQ